MSPWFKLAILTDEVSQDLDAVIRFAKEFALDGIELRSLFGNAFKDLSRSEIAEVGDRCRDANLAIAGCASPVFKCRLDEPSEIAAHVELFKRAVETAHELNCDLVRVFNFLRQTHPATGGELAEAASHFPKLLEVVRGTAIRIGVENEASCIVGTGEEMHEFLRHVPDTAQLGVVWDPCNSLYLDGTLDPVHDEFPLVAARVIHVHVKDARRDGGRAATTCVEFGTGQLNFPAQFDALKTAGYRGWITLETHWRTVPLDAESRHLPAGYSFSANAEAASRICMKHLQSFLAEV